jgi:hypothetical protein
MTPLQGFIAVALFTLLAMVSVPQFDAEYSIRLQRSLVLVMALVFGAVCSMATAEYIHPSPPVGHHPCEVKWIYPPMLDCH